MHQLHDTKLTSTQRLLNLMIEFWLWWTNELAGLIPGWMKQSGSAPVGQVIVEFRDTSIFMLRSVKGKDEVSINVDDESALQRDSLYQQGDKVTLQLADGFYLQKQVSLPLAAAENLRGVLEFEMDRHTPFQASQVYFDFHPVSRNKESQQLVVELVVAPQKAVDRLLNTLSESGLPVSAITVKEQKGLRNINLLEPGLENRSKFSLKARLNNFHIAILIVTLLLAVATVVVPLWQKRTALLELQPLVEQLGAKAASIQFSRRELERLVTENNFLVGKKASKPPSIAILEEIARLLPDDTWIHRVVISNNKVEVVGETASSANAIRLIEESSLFIKANFESPLTKGKSGKERFHLSAELDLAKEPVDMDEAE